jgi:citrate lyase subunit beta/citryl-CoA lyase
MQDAKFLQTPAARAWPLRSLLFVPAHRAEWVVKAIAAKPDGVVLDLEDSVPQGRKIEARNKLEQSITQLRIANVGAVVRINPLGTDTEAELSCAVVSGLNAVMIPKAQSAAEIRELHDMLSYYEGLAGLPRCTVAILPLPETAIGLADARLLAETSDRVAGIVSSISGPVSGDIARAFGFYATTSGVEQLYMNSKLVLDSRAGGAPYPICGVFGVPADDLPAISAMVKKARELGYSGVPVMHPTHVACVNKAFTPTAEDYEYYKGLLATFEQAEKAGQAAVTYQGAMVDYAMLPLAREVIAEYEKRT